MVPTVHIMITLVTSQMALVNALICFVTLTPATFDNDIENIPIKANITNILELNIYEKY